MADSDTDMFDIDNPGTKKADADLHTALKKFLADASTRAGDRTILLNYLSETPSFSEPRNLMPIDDIKDRLEVIRIVERRIQWDHPGWRLTVMQVSTMMAMPMESLQAMKLGPVRYLPTKVNEMAYIICHCKVPHARNCFENTNSYLVLQTLSKDKKASLAAANTNIPPSSAFSESADEPTPSSSSRKQK